MSEKIKKENLNSDPLRSKWLILTGVLATLNILFLLIPAGMNISAIAKVLSLGFGEQITLRLWFPYLGSLSLSALMLLLIALGGFLRRNLMCAIGTLGYGIVFPLATVINRVNGELASVDMIYSKGIKFLNVWMRQFKTHFRSRLFFQYYCYPGLIFLALGILLLSVLFFLRAGKVSGLAMKIICIVIAALSLLTITIASFAYITPRVWNEYLLRYPTFRMNMKVITGTFHYYYTTIRSFFLRPNFPIGFLTADILMNAFRIFSTSIMFLAMGITGAVTVPSAKINKKN